MATVQFTRHLKRFFPDLPAEVAIDAATVAALVRSLDEQIPGLAHYLVEETGAARKHVNVYVNEELIRDRAALSDALSPGDRVFFAQALSGG